MSSRPDPRFDAYKTLQVDPEADPEVIQAAYRRLAQKWHPDVASGAEAAARMVAINRAWEALGEPDRRAAYDLEAARARRVAEAERRAAEAERRPAEAARPPWARGTDRPAESAMGTHGPGPVGDADPAARGGTASAGAGPAGRRPSASEGSPGATTGRGTRPGSGATTGPSTRGDRGTGSGPGTRDRGHFPPEEVSRDWSSGRSATGYTYDATSMRRSEGTGAAGRPPGNPSGSVLNFGRYAGWSLGEIARSDLEYIEWLDRMPIGRPYREEIDAILRRTGRRRTANVEATERRGLFRRR